MVETSEAYLAEMAEFATFSPRAQRHITAMIGYVDKNFGSWTRARSDEEAGNMLRQHQYVDDIRGYFREDPGPSHGPAFCLAALMRLLKQELNDELLDGYPAARFQYERMFGREILLFLPMAFRSVMKDFNGTARLKARMLRQVPRDEEEDYDRYREPAFRPLWVASERGA